MVTEKLQLTCTNQACPKQRRDFRIQPPLRTPMDRFKYDSKCCCCIPIEYGVIMICVLSFLWALIAVGISERYINLAYFPSDDIKKIIKICYLYWNYLFLFTSGIFLVGILFKSQRLINIYLWFTFVYCVLSPFLSMLPVVTATIYCKKIPGRAIFYTGLTVVWVSVFFYFLLVVKHFQYRIWYIFMA